MEIYPHVQQILMDKIDWKNKLWGIFPFQQKPLLKNTNLLTKKYPQPFSTLPAKLIGIMFICSSCKVGLPFMLEYLFHRLNHPDEFIFALIAFMLVLIGSYYLQIQGDLMLTQHKLNVRQTLTKRLVGNVLRGKVPTGISIQYPLWTKITSNINMYVDNYYISIVSLVFQTLKVVIIVSYLYYTLGVILMAGLFLTGAIVQLTIFLSKHIQIAIFRNVKLKQMKLSLIQQFLDRATDFQMTTLDKFIHDQIANIQNLYQRNLTANKMLDCWCVGLWQFTNIGISSFVLCCYYMFARNQVSFEPATIIFLFQLLTFPVNAITWNINGVNNAETAIRQLSELEMKYYNQQVQQINPTKQNKSITLPKQVINAEPLTLQCRKIYSISSPDGLFLKKLALTLRNHTSYSISYAEENGWFQEYLLPTLQLGRNISLQAITKMMTWMECDEIPFEKGTKQLSGGQKMRVSLVRALLHGQLVVIDSDLKSLDPRTRCAVLSNLVELVTSSESEYIILLKDIQNEYAHGHIQCQGQSYKLHVNPCPKEGKPLPPPSQLLSEKLSQLPTQHQQQSKPQQSTTVGLKTFSYYYKSWVHIIFIICLFGLMAMNNYYNYYMSMHDKQYIGDHLFYLLTVTLIYILVLVGRAYLFAVANLRENHRISNTTNTTILMNQPNLYESCTRSALAYTCVNDEESVGNSYSFVVNILFNNIIMVLGSVGMISLQVPSLLPLSILLYVFVHKMNTPYQTLTQQIKSQEKQQQIILLQHINNIQQGLLYLQVYRQESYYYQLFEKEIHQLLYIKYTMERLSAWVKTNYRLVMLTYIAFATVLYAGLFDTSDKEEAGLALLLRYLLTFADYLFYLTISIVDTTNQAVSIERIRKYAEDQQLLLASSRRQALVKQKLDTLEASFEGQATNGAIAELKGVTFEYQPGQKVLSDLHLSISCKDRILVRGKSGSGKTTLCKLLTRTHSHPQMTISANHNISFSSQHPLFLPEASILENADPYHLLPKASQERKKTFMSHIQPLIDKQRTYEQLAAQGKATGKFELSYEQKVVINNMRGYLYGIHGLTIYDQPQVVIQQPSSTYLIITHHGQYPSTHHYQLQGGKLSEQ